MNRPIPSITGIVGRRSHRFCVATTQRLVNGLGAVITARARKPALLLQYWGRLAICGALCAGLGCACYPGCGVDMGGLV